MNYIFFWMLLVVFSFFATLGHNYYDYRIHLNFVYENKFLFVPCAFLSEESVKYGGWMRNNGYGGISCREMVSFEVAQQCGLLQTYHFPSVPMGCRVVLLSDGNGVQASFICVKTLIGWHLLNSWQYMHNINLGRRSMKHPSMLIIIKYV